jgi:hypothetical protein
MYKTLLLSESVVPLCRLRASVPQADAFDGWPLGGVTWPPERLFGRSHRSGETAYNATI